MSRAASTFFPTSSSVSAEVDAIAAAQPNVFARASVTTPSITRRVSFTRSPHAGLRTRAAWVGLGSSPVFLGLRKWSITVGLYSSKGITALALRRGWVDGPGSRPRDDDRTRWT